MSLEGLKCQLKLLHLFSNIQLWSSCHSGSWTANSSWFTSTSGLFGRGEWGLPCQCCTSLSSLEIITPLKETKTQTIWFPEATFTYCHGSHIRIEQEAILGSLSQAGSSRWNQHFSAQYCLTTTKIPTWVLLLDFSRRVLSSPLSFRDTNQSQSAVHLLRPVLGEIETCGTQFRTPNCEGDL